MKTNVGTLDKAIRISIAVLIAVLYFKQVITGNLALIAGLLAVIAVITSFIGFCPLYVPFKINTRGKQNSRDNFK